MNQSEATKLAERWATQGWHAFPVAVAWDEGKRSTNKRPLTRSGFHDATTDPARVRSLFAGGSIRAGEEWGVGLCPGMSGRMVLDVDVKGGQRGDEELADLEEQHDKLPPGPVIITASGGQHIILEKGDRPVDNTDLASGVEVRSDSGFIVAPGTTTPWGSWQVDEATRGTPIPPAPAWLFEVLAANGAKTGGGSTGGHWRPLDEAELVDADRTALAELRRLGGHGEYLKDGCVQVTRPGKAAGSSASVGYIGPGVVKVFTPNWPPLQQGAVYEVDDLCRIADLIEAGDDEGAQRAADPVASLLNDPANAPSSSDVPPFAIYNPAMAFPLERVWPPALVAFVRQLGVATSTDPAMVATLALPVLAAAIGNSRAVAMTSTWEERGNLWTVVVAPPSVGKSPVGRAVRAPLLALQHDHDLIYASEHEQWEVTGNGTAPAARHLVVSNTTVEALSEAMRNHSRGTVLFRDELSGWLRSMSQYKGGAGDDRQIFLELWGREDVRITRKGKPPITQHDPHLSITGTTQPGVLTSLLGTVDGFGQRFLVCVPPVLHGNERAPDVTAAAIADYDRLVRGLYRLEGDEYGRPLLLEWAPGARDAMVDFRQQFRDEQASDALSPVLQEVWGKARAYLGRLTVILAATWGVAEGIPEIVTPEIIESAARVVAYYLNQSVAVYGEGIDEPPPERNKLLGPSARADLIHALRRSHPRTLREIHHNLRSWRHVAPRAAVEEVLSMSKAGELVVTRRSLSNGHDSFTIDLPPKGAR